MKDKVYKILLIEDSTGDARLIEEKLKEEDCPFILEIVGSLAQGLRRLEQEGIDLILTDLSLPDSQGLSTLQRLLLFPAQPPVVVLTGLDDETTAVEAVRIGAEDYLVKERLDGRSLVRSLLYALERHRLKEQLKSNSYIDDLTGLYNRRGFITIGKQLLAQRNGQRGQVVLFFADLDQMKWINDNLGHAAGDQALIEAAAILKRTFRKSDLVARIGGDEFAVLISGMEGESSEVQALVARLRKNSQERKSDWQADYPLSFSIGATLSDPGSLSLEALLSRADQAMYEEKQAKKKRLAFSDQ